MYHTNSPLRLFGFIVVLTLLCSAHAEIVSGTSVMRLQSPATPAVRNEAVSIAADSLKRAIHDWMQDTDGFAPDLSNPVKRHFFNLFVKSCLSKAKQDSFFEGREWVLNLDVKDSDIRDAMVRHNAWCDSIANHNWMLVQSAIQNNQFVVLYKTCVNALFYAMGTLVKTPADGGVELQARKTLQDFLGKLSLSYSLPIIKGKPGEISVTEISIKAMTGEIPFSDLVLLARLPDGTQMTTLTTDKQGEAVLKKVKIPFVAYGTFMHVVPNFGACINTGYQFEAGAFGLQLNESQEQTIIFNIIKPAYKLTYQAAAANNAQIPADFSRDVWLRKFLEDSCHMVPATGDKPADLIVDLRCQVSSYTYDEREETDMKVEMQASIKQTRNGGGMSNKVAVIHNDTFDSNHDIPSGQFFWQTTSKLKIIIRQMLAEL